MNRLAKTTASARDVAHYDPEEGLKIIAVAEASEKHMARAMPSSPSKRSMSSGGTVWSSAVATGAISIPEAKLANANLASPTPIPALSSCTSGARNFAPKGRSMRRRSRRRFRGGLGRAGSFTG